VQAVADDYVGYRWEPWDAYGDGGHHVPLPGRWVGGEFLRYDVTAVYVVHLFDSAQTDEIPHNSDRPGSADDRTVGGIP
jgi:hypothetical protein